MSISCKSSITCEVPLMIFPNIQGLSRFTFLLPLFRQGTGSSQELDTPEIYPRKETEGIQEIDAPMEERSNEMSQDDGQGGASPR